MTVTLYHENRRDCPRQVRPAEVADLFCSVHPGPLWSEWRTLWHWLMSTRGLNCGWDSPSTFDRIWAAVRDRRRHYAPGAKEAS
jgi:hypothetical protein